MKYSAKITDIGSEALQFLTEETCRFIIIFNNDAPLELAEISVMHEKAELKELPVKGDKMKVCGKEYTITAVGEEAIATLKELGHCTVSFKGLEIPARPGIIELLGERLKPEDIKKGETIEIY